MAPPLNLLRWCRGIDGLSHAHVNKSSGRSDMAQFARADKLLSPLIAYEHCKRSAAHSATGNPCASRSSPPPARRPREQAQQQAAIRMCHCVTVSLPNTRQCSCSATQLHMKRFKVGTYHKPQFFVRVDICVGWAARQRCPAF